MAGVLHALAFSPKLYSQINNFIMEQWLYLILFGAVAGFIAGQLVGGGGRGVIVNIFVGVIGAIVGGFLFDRFNINLNTGMGWLNKLIEAVAGASVLLIILGILGGGRRR